MSVKDIFAAAFNKDASSFETAFSSVMKEKVIAAVENKFFAVEEYELEESKYEDDEDEEDDEEDEDDEELDEERTDMYVGTVKRDDPDYAKKVAELKSKTVGGHRVRGRAPTPEHKHLYQQGGALHRSSSQDIKPEHASRVDVYSRKPMKEETLDELSTSTLKSYRTAAWKDAGKAYRTSDSSRKSDAERYAAHKRGDKRMAGYELATAKTGAKPNKTYQDSGASNIPNAKIKSTKEEVSKE
jgi:hypothetical protein